MAEAADEWLSYAPSLPATAGGRVAFMHGGNTREGLAAAIDRAVAAARAEGYEQGYGDGKAGRPSRAPRTEQADDARPL